MVAIFECFRWSCTMYFGGYTFSLTTGAGSELLSRTGLMFSCLVIDEAAQCVELDTLVPLKYSQSKCVLVGDPQQLPATVLSETAKRYNYDQSLFQRYQVCVGRSHGGGTPSYVFRQQCPCQTFRPRCNID